MPDALPSLDLIAAEVDHERDAQIRHMDAVDTKAGIVLGAAGALVAIASTRLEVELIPGLVFGLASALLAMTVLLPYSFPGWELRRLRDRFVRSEPGFARLHVVDTMIVMVERMKEHLERKVWRLKCAIGSLALAAVSLGAGSIAAIGG